MKRIADALELLTAQHEAISTVLAKVPSVEVSGLAHVLGKLADQVSTHLAIEEQFMSMLGLTVPVAAHEALRGALGDILLSDMSSPDLTARLAAFSASWAAHASAQEHAIFIPVAETVTPTMLEDIGLQLGAWSEQSRCIAA